MGNRIKSNGVRPFWQATNKKPFQVNECWRQLETESIQCEVVCIIKYLSPFLCSLLSISTFMHVYNGNQKLKDKIILTETIPKPFSSSTICHAWRMEKKAHHKYLMEKQRHTHTEAHKIETYIGSIQTRLKKINTHTKKMFNWTEEKKTQQTC